MRRWAVIQGEQVHQIAELADDFDPRCIYHSSIELVEVTGADVYEGDRMLRQVAFEPAERTMGALEQKLSTENLAKFVEIVYEALIALRDQQAQVKVTLPAKTLTALTRYEALK